MEHPVYETIPKKADGETGVTQLNELKDEISRLLSDWQYNHDQETAGQLSVLEYEFRELATIATVVKILRKVFTGQVDDGVDAINSAARAEYAKVAGDIDFGWDIHEELFFEQILELFQQLEYGCFDDRNRRFRVVKRIPRKPPEYWLPETF